MRRSATESNPALTKAIATAKAGRHLPAWLAAIMLVLVTVSVYWPATGYDFVNLDDPTHVTGVVQVQNGLSLAGIKWAFLSPVAANWHPLTVLSHMLDCQMFGLQPWGHHLTNVLLHALNAGLVFALLRQMTGATWRSLLVAGLFALHPLRVESVAWVTERKDVLSAFFGLLGLMAYVRYAQGRMQNAERGTRCFWYWTAVVLFACGLMSKPMLVTWPCVMLLLDYWPLGRMHIADCQSPIANWKSEIGNRKSEIVFPLLVEKIPFFVLAALMSLVTFVVQKRGGALAVGQSLPLGARGGNALISYCRYVGKLFWPADLAVVYPHPGHWPPGDVVLAGGLLLGISVLVWAQRRRYPFLLMGWLWYCGTLVPVSQVIQTGTQAMADRWTYLPSLGLLILTIWGACELVQGKADGQKSEVGDTQHATRIRVQSPIANRQSPILLGVAGGAAVVLCVAATRHQLGYWKDSETLLRHAVEVTESNDLAHKNLGAALYQRGQTDEALRQFQEGVRLKPNDADAHNDLGNALLNKGQVDEAIGQFREAIRLKPDYVLAYNNLGVALDLKGQTDEAISQFREVIRLRPGSAEAHCNLGATVLKKGEIDEAIRQYQEAISLKPDYAKAHNNLGAAFCRQGRTDEAIREFQEALRLKPDYADARRNLDAVLALKARSPPPPGPLINR